MASLFPPRMPKKSPPKHRHDGSSPLPLGMDWSPPPKKWEGRDTVWPHDPQSGWSYCITIPSWIVQTESKASAGSFIEPVVFYRVQVGIQSPEGVTFTREVFRRFSDFLKLYNAVKHLFPKKTLPPAPPKHRFLRINSSKALLEERRCALEEWMGKLLSDIDLSRSVPVASFLELEAAARSSFQDKNQKHSNTTPDSSNGGSAVWMLQSSTSSAGSMSAGAKASISVDYYSDNTYEASDLGTPRQGRDLLSETGSDDLLLDQDLTSAMSSFAKKSSLDGETGLFSEETMQEPLDEFPDMKIHPRKDKNIVGGNSLRRNTSSDLTLDLNSHKIAGHARKFSGESVGSDISSVRGSEISNSGAGNSGDNSADIPGDSEVAGLPFSDRMQVVLPLDMRNKMNRVLTTIQRRLVTAKTDMEDLLARLNQEMAVKEYLTTKVKDLDIELETSKQKSKETLQQAILIERERVTQMQWDLEELRRSSLEMEAKLKSEQDERNLAESAKIRAIDENVILMQELDLMREKCENLQKIHEDLELKSRADIKVLVKEVKSLRKTQTELKQELSRSLKQRSELEEILQNENDKREKQKHSSEKLLHECRILHSRLQDCSVNILAEEEDRLTVDSSSHSDALDLLTTSDNRIGLLLAEAQLLAQDDENLDRNQGGEHHSSVNINGNDLRSTENEVRKMLTDIFIENAQLRKQVNTVLRCALRTTVKLDQVNGEDGPPLSRKTVLNKFLEK